jgi:hypothetical protein
MKGATWPRHGLPRGTLSFDGWLNIVLAQIGHFWRFLGHLEGDLIPKRGQIFVGSWASITEPKNYINQAFELERVLLYAGNVKEQFELMAHFSCFEGH